MNDVSMPPQVPALEFLLRHRGLISFIVALLPIAAGLAALSVGRSWLWLAFAVVLAIAAWFAARCAVELVSIVVDTLLPR
jgi:hypothetical protein